MIYDNLTQFHYYEAIHPLFPEVSRFLQRTDLLQLSPGRHPLSSGAFVGRSDYMTCPDNEAFIECHRQYIDIQILLAGSERIGICHRDDCRAEPYQADLDLQKLSGEVAFITLRPGNFAVFFPHDGHMPQVCISAPEPVTKLVFKIPVSLL